MEQASYVPLASIRILDFTRYQQGPYATVMLGDMGAEVIKVEDRERGDLGRRLWREPDGFSAFFEALNRGKRSITLDVRKPEGREVALRLVGRCDVVVENFRPGVMDRLGLGYEHARKVNPRVIFASASGFGPRGPRGRWPSFDQVAQAASGWMHALGGPEGEPRLGLPGMMDQIGAMILAWGITTALLARERTGVGQSVDASLLGTAIALQAVDVTHSLRTGRVNYPRRRTTPIVGHFQCADGRWLMVGAVDPKMWLNLCQALDRPDLPTDPRFKNGYVRETNHLELEAELEQAFLTHDRDTWIRLLREADVPVGPANTYVDLREDEDAHANEYVVRRDDSRWGDLEVVGCPVRLSATPARVGDDAPELGADTDAVLRELGFSEAEVAKLRADAVI